MSRRTVAIVGSTATFTITNEPGADGRYAMTLTAPVDGGRFEHDSSLAMGDVAASMESTPPHLIDMLAGVPMKLTAEALANLEPGTQGLVDVEVYEPATKLMTPRTLAVRFIADTTEAG